MSNFTLIQQFREEVRGNFNALATACQKNDRRNFEAFIFAKVIHRVLCKTPFLGKRYERVFKLELDVFMASMSPADAPAPDKKAATAAAVGDVAASVMPATEVLRSAGRAIC